MRAAQTEKFAALMRHVLDRSAFYQDKYRQFPWTSERPPDLEELVSLPFTTKAELVEDQRRQPPFGTVLTEPLERYTRVHRTSGTAGQPLNWLDTAASWQWLIDCWLEIYRAAGVGADDRILVAFSFGPFMGFWAAFDAACQLGALAIPGGGLSSRQRLDMLEELEVTVIACTPTYALRLAGQASEEGRRLAEGPVRMLIHAGEPGASVATIRSRIESAWGARCVDHAGATEVGAWGYGCGHEDHLHIIEAEFIAEVIDADSSEPAAESAEGVEAGELVMTSLGRLGSPLVRYRTGDLVELSRLPCGCGRQTAYLRGGVLGRIDNMLIVRGVNIFPSAVEGIIREFAEIDEFEVRLESKRAMGELVILVEVIGGDPARVGDDLCERIHDKLMLRPKVEVVERGTLPRYELKARRFKLQS
ncbi:MAG: phenylacetate--CoA ligase family protein [Acidobacteriota bacterium]